jgi:hypothetical protein
MEGIAEIRDKIYEHFHSSHACQKVFFDQAQEGRYVAYYTSMYLLQDTTESLMVHRKKGFSSDPFEAYIEFWGVMQAIIIQQDSIAELHEAITGSTLDTRQLISWQAIRKLRNKCAGHPARGGRSPTSPLTRTFMGRDFGGYSLLTYEQWQAGGGISHPALNFGELLDQYAEEAEDRLSFILGLLVQQWPDT